MLKQFIAGLLVQAIVLIGLVVSPAQAQTTRSDRPDPRGLDRYTLTSETAPLSIFSLPAYNGRRDFFDGYGRKSADELGLTGAEFWNEFGSVARKGYLHDKAVIWFRNGFQYGEYLEGYLEGCTKSGRPYFNRVKIQVPVKPQVPVTPPKVLCVNIAIALEDVPPDWTKTRNPDGSYTCTWPTPEPEIVTRTETIDNTCRPTGNARIVDWDYKRDNRGKAKNPRDIINASLSSEQASVISERIEVTESTSEVTRLIVYSNGCDYSLYAYSSVRKGVGWWYWALLGAAVVGAFALGYYWKRDRKIVTPIKTQTPAEIPRRPVIRF